MAFQSTRDPAQGRLLLLTAILFIACVCVDLVRFVNAQSDVYNEVTDELTKGRKWTHPAGIQHDEVKSGFGTVPNLFDITWTKGARDLPKTQDGKFSNATMHRSVYERFDMAKVPETP
jgi:hypothetical protein